jgi:hypothetical protein
MTENTIFVTKTMKKYLEYWKLFSYKEIYYQVYCTIEWSETVIKLKRSMLNLIGVLLLPKNIEGANVICIIKEDWSNGSTVNN